MHHRWHHGWLLRLHVSRGPCCLLLYLSLCEDPTRVKFTTLHLHLLYHLRWAHDELVLLVHHLSVFLLGEELWVETWLRLPQDLLVAHLMHPFTERLHSVMQRCHVPPSIRRHAELWLLFTVGLVGLVRPAGHLLRVHMVELVCHAHILREAALAPRDSKEVGLRVVSLVRHRLIRVVFPTADILPTSGFDGVIRVRRLEPMHLVALTCRVHGYIN